MQRATAAAAGRLAGSIGLVLMLSLSFSAHAVNDSTAAYAATGAVDPSLVPARWRNYALSSITPRFSWTADALRVQAPQITDVSADNVSFAIALGAIDTTPAAYFGFSIARDRVDNRVVALASSSLDVAAELPRTGLQRTIVAHPKPVVTRLVGPVRAGGLGTDLAPVPDIPPTTGADPHDLVPATKAARDQRSVFLQPSGKLQEVCPVQKACRVDSYPY
jgi:hypothetical protein